MLAGLSGACTVGSDSVASPLGLPGFTCPRRVEVQIYLGVLLPHVVPEIHVLLPSPFSFGPSTSVPGSAYRLLHLSALECLNLPTTWHTTPSADFCLAVRLPLGLLSRSRDTRQISWGKFSHFPCAVAESTLRTLVDMDFVVSRPLVRR